MAAAVSVQPGAAVGSSRIARSGALARPAAAGATPQSRRGGDRAARRPPSQPRPAAAARSKVAAVPLPACRSARLAARRGDQGTAEAGDDDVGGAARGPG